MTLLGWLLAIAIGIGLLAAVAIWSLVVLAEFVFAGLFADAKADSDQPRDSVRVRVSQPMYRVALNDHPYAPGGRKRQSSGRRARIGHQRRRIRPSTARSALRDRRLR